MASGSILFPPQIIPMHNRRSTTIDTNTLIQIQHDRNDVDLYYTLDGNKPDRFVTVSTRKSTLSYRKPFYISRQIGMQGRVVIKAIAVSSDGLYESAIATRMFTIRVVQPDHPNTVDDENKYVYLLQQERQLLMEKLHTETDHLQRKSWENTQRFINEPFSKEKLSQLPYLDPSQSPLDIPRCAHCLAPKTDDPYTRYCTECGLPWQQLTHQPPIKPTIRNCSRCESAIPFNLDVCVVCETPAVTNYVSPTLSSSIVTSVNILCPKCKSDNPSHARTCGMCQSQLFPVTHPSKRASVAVPSDTSNSCFECQRVNKPNARFCDQCGASRPKPSITIACTQCQAKNQSTSKFCLSCGCVLQVPLRLMDTRLSHDFNNPANSMISHSLTDPSINARWLNAKTTLIYDRQSGLMNKSEAATQTYGIYYPSVKDLNQVLTQNRQLLEKQEFPQRPSRLTMSSPGKGYWKRQIDHVYTHLQAYAADRPEFRSLIGEPVMGPLVRADVEENNQEIIIQVVFRRNDNEKLSHQSTKERPAPFHAGYDSDDEYKREKIRSAKPKTRPHSASAHDSKKTVNQHLIELLKQSARSSRRRSDKHGETMDEVRRLLKHGADSNVRDENGSPALHLAVINGHYHCLPVLVKEGRAKLDLPDPLGNTALHECCLLKSDGVEPLRILLKLGGQATWKNKKGESVIDLANKQHCPELLECIQTVRDQEEAKEYRRSSSASGARHSGKA